MVFTEPTFLFLLLPLTLLLCVFAPVRVANAVLLVASLIFYAWGEPVHIALLLVSVGFNYVAGLWVEDARGTGRARLAIVTAVVVNLGLLVSFKYAAFAAREWNALADGLGIAQLPVPGAALPVGISFFTFQAMSYVIDVHRRDAAVQRNPFDLALYIALFPQLVAGPIVRYQDVADQIRSRHVTLHDFGEGVRRFTLGLAKKMLLANTLAVGADAAFGRPAESLSARDAWVGAICYGLQIYFDFSGYSDMAVGMGRMLGFTFVENFRLPYVATSITDFWRRWHISLSTWFRDYLYIPIGGNRGGPLKTARNLFVVFLLCGLWHGASWSFLVWGAFHGLFLALERTPFGSLLAGAPRLLRHGYAMIVVLVGWVLFRAETLTGAMSYLASAFGRAPAANAADAGPPIADLLLWVAIAAGVLCCGPLPSIWNSQRWASRVHGGVVVAVEAAAYSCLLLACACLAAAGTYDPFIYFRF